MRHTDDPYSVLGLRWGASPASIQRAFRRLALVHHPDRNAGDPRSEARFKLISAAYQRLKAEDWVLPAAASRTARDGAAPFEGEPATWPQYWPDGAPIYYPTAEEIEALCHGGEARRRFRALAVSVTNAAGKLCLFAIVVGLALVGIVNLFRWIASW